MITIRFPPLQSFMEYVFDTYSELRSKCISKDIDVDSDDCIDCCSDSYYGGDVQYKCRNSKRIYLIRYLAAQIKQIDLALNQNIRDDICGRHNIKAISLGGGPGTEAIALMDVVRDFDNDVILRFDNVDTERSWKNIYRNVTGNFSNRISNIKLKAGFSPSGLKHYAKTAEVLYDITFVSWLFSLIKKPQEISSILNMLKRLMKKNSYLVISDRFEDIVVANISKAIKDVDKLALIEYDRQIQWCGVMFPDDLRDKFKVRLNADSVYWILKKNP